MTYNKCLILVLLVTSFCKSQNEPKIGIQFTAGFPTYSSAWIDVSYLFQYSQDQYIYPKYAFQLGAEYGPLYSLFGTDVSVMIDASISKGATKEFKSSDGSIKINGYIERNPLLLWGKFKTNNQLSPFLQFGFGITETRLINQINIPNLQSFDIDNWQLCLGYGAGFSYSVNENVICELLATGWFTNDDIEQNISGINKGYQGNMVVALVGVKIIYFL